MYYDFTWPPPLVEAFLRAQQIENYNTGHRANEKGKLAELRCLNAVSELIGICSWIHHVRLATSKEDARGIDVVVETDVGKLYLQVKSSHNGARKYRYKRPRAKTIILIIMPEMSNEKIFNTVQVRLGCLRKHFKKIRRQN